MRSSRPSCERLEPRELLSQVVFDGEVLSVTGNDAPNLVLAFPILGSTVVVVDDATFRIPVEPDAIRLIVVEAGGGDDYLDFSALSGFQGMTVLDGGGGLDTILGSSGADSIRGGSGDDYLVGGFGPDTIDGGDGQDLLDGGDGLLADATLVGGDDRLIGGAGDDTITGGSGDDTIDAGPGDNLVDAGVGVTIGGVLIGAADSISSGDGDDTIVSHDGDDTIEAGGGRNVVDAGAGDDRVTTGSGIDSVDAGTGRNWVSAGAGPDTLVAGPGDDTLLGGGGDDRIEAGDGRNLVDAGDGRNTVVAGSGDDTISAGADDDTIESGGGRDLVDAGDGRNRLRAGAGHDTIRSGAGRDDIDAGEGDDLIESGGDGDLILGGGGHDTIRPGDGDDSVSAGSGDDLVEGGAGADTIDGGEGNDLIDGGEGTDVLLGRPGDDTLIGGAGADFLDGDDGADILLGGDGPDTINGGGGPDLIIGGDGADSIVAGTSLEFDGETIVGGIGNDTIVSGGGPDSIEAGEGDDHVDAGPGPDLVDGGEGNDRLEGGAGNDAVFGRDGNDSLSGGDGRDELSGGEGVDLLLGGTGNDRIDGGPGYDFLEGGSGFDTIVAGDGRDTVNNGSLDDLIEFVPPFDPVLLGSYQGLGWDLPPGVDVFPPAPPSAVGLLPEDDTGAPGDGITRVLRPRLTGFAEPGSTVELFDALGHPLATSRTGVDGRFHIQFPEDLAEGMTKALLRVRDPAGNVGQASAIALVVDRTPPPAARVPVLRGSDDGVTRVRAPSFEVGGVEPGAEVQLLRDGVVVARRSGPGVLSDPGVPGDGAYRYAARQVDAAGNLGPAGPGLTVVVDATPPAAAGAPVLRPSDDTGVRGDGVTRVRAPSFEVGGVEPGAEVQLLRDGVVVARRSGPGVLSDPGVPGDGAYRYAARQVDAAGNLGPAGPGLTVVVDATPPAAAGAPVLRPSDDTGVRGDGVTRVRAPSFEVGGVEPGAEVQLLRDGVVVARRSGPGVLSDPGVPGDGAYRYAARQVDAAGNLGPAGPGLTVVVDATPPAAAGAPVLRPSDDTGVRGDGVTRVRAPSFEVGGVEPGAEVQLLRDGVVVARRSGPGVLSDPGVPGDGAYRYAARQVDAAGNLGPAGPGLTVVVDATPPAAAGAPVLRPSDDTGVRGDGVTRVRAPSFEVGGVEPGAEVQLLRDGVVVARRSGPGVLSDPGVPGDGAYRYAARQVDAAGNAGPAGGSVTVVVDNSVRTPTPRLLDADDTGVVGDHRTAIRRPRIVGITDPGAMVELLDSSGAVVEVVEAAADGSFVVSPPALPPGPARFSVRARDAAGNVAVGPAIKLRILGTPGDHDGNGVADLAVFRPATGEWLVALKDGTGATLGVRVERFGDTQLRDVPAPADYDGNGVADLAVFRPATGEWLVALKDGTGATLGVRVERFGDTQLRDVPAPADYDGNGVADLAVFRPATGEWLVALKDGTGATLGVRVERFGDTQLRDVPAPADYDGNGVADLAVFRPATGEWLVALKDGTGATLGVRVERFGDTQLRDVPAPADYDGNGVADLAVLRPTSDQFLVLQKDPDGVTIGSQISQARVDGWGRIPVEIPTGSLAALGVVGDSGGGTGSARFTAGTSVGSTDVARGEVLGSGAVRATEQPIIAQGGRHDRSPGPRLPAPGPASTRAALRGSPVRFSRPASLSASAIRHGGRGVDRVRLIDEAIASRLRFADELAMALTSDRLPIAANPFRSRP
ncbi:Ig-like domain-containing protein [Tautonia plasticadhaerens]|uniref:Ig-like domain-containing protein n=1 Tax=Tautonia plasticadhaerens TaxID=2527974 RepID=UPI0018D2691C|nr:Ig-like domain-containing protein [Tautonia plasticadhaerens]